MVMCCVPVALKKPAPAAGKPRPPIANNRMSKDEEGVVTPPKTTSEANKVCYVGSCDLIM